jgi:hypothetical protein
VTVLSQYIYANLIKIKEAFDFLTILFSKLGDGNDKGKAS